MEIDTVEGKVNVPYPNDKIEVGDIVLGYAKGVFKVTGFYPTIVLVDEKRVLKKILQLKRLFTHSMIDVRDKNQMYECSDEFARKICFNEALETAREKATSYRVLLELLANNNQ